jgi:glutamine synthetase
MEKRKSIEYRIRDPSSNIYLVEAALLLAGLDGINKKIQAPAPVDKDIYKLSEQQKKAYGIKNCQFHYRREFMGLYNCIGCTIIKTSI